MLSVNTLLLPPWFDLVSLMRSPYSTPTRSLVGCCCLFDSQRIVLPGHSQNIVNCASNTSLRHGIKLVSIKFNRHQPFWTVLTPNRTESQVRPDPKNVQSFSCLQLLVVVDLFFQKKEKRVIPYDVHSWCSDAGHLEFLSKGKAGVVGRAGHPLLTQGRCTSEGSGSAVHPRLFQNCDWAPQMLNKCGHTMTYCHTIHDDRYILIKPFNIFKQLKICWYNKY